MPRRAATLIRERRRERGITVADLARAVGVSQRTVTNWEAGKGVRLSHARLLVDVLGGTIVEYVGSAPARVKSEIVDEVIELLSYSGPTIENHSPPIDGQVFWSWLLKRGVTTLQAYVVNPAHPDFDALLELRAQVLLTGLFRVEHVGQDEYAELRQRYLSVISRILATS